MINVALVGNPNTGKTTLYNLLTSSFEHVGNWHGVTVEEREKVYSYKNSQIKLVDLPGVYSLSPLSYEEEVTNRYLLEKNVDVVINICDASNLKRNLYLSLSLLEMGIPTIILVNQIDKRPICKINFSMLENLLGVKVLPIFASKKESIAPINDAILATFGSDFHKTKLPYLKDIDTNKFSKLINVENKDLLEYYTIKVLEDDTFVKEKFGIKTDFGQMEKIAKLRYKFIDDVLGSCCSPNERVYGQSKLDKILLNRFLALPIFLCIIALAFYLTFFSVGAFFSDLLNSLLSLISTPILKFLIKAFGDGWIVSLFNVAILGGVGSILTFLPQVALLFLFLSLLEDSGYLSRVAFVFEDILGKIGLSGRSVYTLLMGFGCSTTAVMTARTMDDKNSKIKTSLLTPYMSCSAKFPIYSVLGGAFFGVNNIFVIFGLYFLGVFVAILTSLIFEKTILKSKEQSFILEFPPYRMMNGKRVVRVLLSNVKDFLVRVASLILAMNVIVWLLSNFTITFHYVGEGGVSILETLGHIFAPIFKPLGFNSWGLVSALFAGLVAKEVIISSIAMFNGVDDAKIAASIKNPASPAFFATKSALLSYLVFCLLYFPCLATASVLGKEIGKKWLFIGVIFEFITAYLCAFMVFRIALAVEQFGFMRVFIFLLSLVIIVVATIVIIKKLKHKNFCPHCKKSCKKRNHLS